VAVLLPGKFIFLAHPHTGSSSMVLALQDAFPEALDVRPHHMSLADVRGDTGTAHMEQISRARGRIWDHRPGKRPGPEVTPKIVRELVTGDEHVFSVLRNPYDFLATCYVRRGRGTSFVDFVRSYDERPYVEAGRLYYHEPDSDTLLRYELLQAGLDLLMEKLGLPRIELGRHNETPNKDPWDTYYTPETYRVVNSRFGDEFSKFYEPRSS